MGITGNLSSAGKVVIILAMFIGRMGVVTFGLAILASRRRRSVIHEVEADLAV
jgi:trk system potassium uptake protein TrkH